MKKKRLVVAVLATILVAAIGGMYLYASGPNEMEKQPGKETVGEGGEDMLPPAVISCNRGASGRCFKPVCDLEGLIPVFGCRYTGYQTDYCPMSMYYL